MKGYITELSEVTETIYNSVYKDILNGVKSLVTEVNISSYLISSDFVLDIIKDILYLNPDIFYINSIDNISVLSSGNIYMETGYKIAKKVKFLYPYSTSLIPSMKLELENMKNEIMKFITISPSKLDKILQINQYVNTFGLNNVDDNSNYLNIYEILKNQKCNNNTLFKITSYLLFCCEIPYSIYHYKTENDEITKIGNVVFIDDNNYHLINQTNVEDLSVLKYSLKSDDYINNIFSSKENQLLHGFSFENALVCSDVKYDNLTM